LGTISLFLLFIIIIISVKFKKMKSTKISGNKADNRDRVAERSQRDNKSLYEMPDDTILETHQEIDGLSSKEAEVGQADKRLAYKQKRLLKLENAASAFPKADKEARKFSQKKSGANFASETVGDSVMRDSGTNIQPFITDAISDPADLTSIRTGSAGSETSAIQKEGPIDGTSNMTDAEFAAVWESFQEDLQLIEGCVGFRFLNTHELESNESECVELATRALYAFQDALIERAESGSENQALEILLDRATRLLAGLQGFQALKRASAEESSTLEIASVLMKRHVHSGVTFMTDLLNLLLRAHQGALITDEEWRKVHLVLAHLAPNADLSFIPKSNDNRRRDMPGNHLRREEPLPERSQAAPGSTRYQGSFGWRESPRTFQSERREGDGLMTSRDLRQSWIQREGLPRSLARGATPLNVRELMEPFDSSLGASSTYPAVKPFVQGGLSKEVKTKPLGDPFNANEVQEWQRSFAEESNRFPLAQLARPIGVDASRLILRWLDTNRGPLEPSFTLAQLTHDEFYDVLLEMNSIQAGNATFATFLATVEEVIIPTTSFTGGSSNIPAQIGVFSRALTACGLFHEGKHGLVVLNRPVSPHNARKLVKAILSRILLATAESFKMQVTEIVGALDSLFADNWNYDLAQFFQKCDLAIVEYVQSLARKTANATAGKHATGLFSSSSNERTQPDKAASKKFVGAISTHDRMVPAKRKPDHQGGTGKQQRTEAEYALCEICGNIQAVSQPCPFRNHPDANHDPNTKWIDSMTGKIYAEKMGGVSKKAGPGEKIDFRIQRMGIHWKRRIINGELSFDPACTWDMMPRKVLAMSNSSINYFTYPCRVYRADKSFDATVIVDTGSQAGNFISERLVRKIISLDCTAISSNLRLCSCTGNCTTCHTSFLLNLAIDIPLRQLPIILENQLFHVLNGLPAEILLGAGTIHDNRILEQLTSSNSTRTAVTDPGLVMIIQRTIGNTRTSDSVYISTQSLPPGQDITIEQASTPELISLGEGQDMDLEDQAARAVTDLLNPPKVEVFMHTGHNKDSVYQNMDLEDQAERAVTDQLKPPRVEV
jgi:hypothetical protein